MIVAFEGPDLSGKTTLLREIRERDQFYGWPEFRMFMSERAYKDSGDYLQRASEVFHSGLSTMRKFGSFFLDRCYVSAAIYGLVYGREYDYSWVDRAAKTLRPFIVYVRTPWEVVAARQLKDPDWLQTDAMLRRAWMEYETWWNENPWGDKVIVANGGDRLVKDVADEVIDTLNKWTRKRTK